ncbi:MAG: CesD/SycD/LcrH family type III secretion system chaperone [Verrucomicrobia bacterium]|nr:CesD/SycD/LcrH family type III secretion system chaperone [Verrucomicrobiota bacterium]
MTTKNQSNKPLASLSQDEQAEIMAETAYQALSKNIPLFITRGLEQKHMDALYAEGYYFYSQAKYKEALPLFKGLTFYHSADQRGWLGAAGCYEMLKQYEQALTCYSFAAILNADDPIPALHAFDCYIALKNYEKALACLEAVILLSSKKPEHTELKKRAEFLRDALKKIIAEQKNS